MRKSINNDTSQISDEITRRKIESFDNSIYDQQNVIEDAKMIKNDINLKNVDWSWPQCNMEGSVNYCQGFMSSANDQMLDHYNYDTNQMKMKHQ